MHDAAPPEHAARITATVMGVAFLGTLGVGVFAFAFPLLAFRESLSATWIGAAFSGYFLAKLLLAPVAGRLADRTGPRRLLLLALSGGTLLPLAALAAPSLPVLYAVQFGLGLCGGATRPVCMALLGAAAPDGTQGRVFGWYNAVFNLSFFLGPVLGGLLFFSRDFTPVLLTLALSMAAALALVAVGLPRRAATVRPAAEAPEESPAVLSAGRPHRTPATWRLLLAVAGRTMGIATMITFLPILLTQSLPGAKLLAGLLFAGPSLVAALLLPLGGRLADRVAPEPATGLGMGLSSAGLFLLGLAHTPFGFAACGALIGLGAAISIPASMRFASSLDRRQGRIMGIVHGAANAGFLVGPLLGGLAVSTSLAVPAAFHIGGVVGLACCLPLLFGFSLERAHYGRRTAEALGLLAAVLVLAAVPAVLRPPPSLAPYAARSDNARRPSANAPGVHRFATLAMGTVIRVTLDVADPVAAGDAAEHAFAAVRSLQLDFDHRNHAGAVGRINHNAGVRPVRVPERVFRVIERAVAFGRESGGVFDVTIGAATVTPLYFAEDDAVLEAKRDFVDYRRIVLDAAARTVYLPRKGMALDLGGLAKGSIIDLAVAELRRRGVPRGIVEAGGDFYCFGGRDWTVGVESPRGEGVLGTIRVRGRGVCGSGDYRRFATDSATGERRGHILDVRSMHPATASAGVTVIADTAETADALATTVFVMGPREGAKFLAEHHPDAAALWILPDLSTAATPNFPALSR